MSKRYKRVGFLVLMLAMILALAGSSLAEDATATPTPTETAEADAQETPSPEPTAASDVKETEEAPETPEAEDDEEAGETLVTPSLFLGEGNGVELTVYNQNLALVKEVRTFDLEAGSNEVRYADVAAEIDPTSVHFVSLTDPEGTVVLEQNYEYDVVSSRKLLLKYVDKEIALRTKDGAVYTGTLLSGADDVILQTPDSIKVVKLAQIQELSFPALPEGLITTPTLVWLLKAQEAGEQDVRVTYLTRGIDWRANYIAVLAADDEALGLTGWMTIDNQSGATYRDAKLKLVAGDVHQAPQAEYALGRADAVLLKAVAVPEVEERSLFEYHIYEVKRPVTVRDRQTKQIEFVSAPQVTAEKYFVYSASPPYMRLGTLLTDPNYGVWTGAKVQVRVEFANSEGDGLGLPLPKGIIRVYKEDADGGAEFVGEDAIDHTPKDENVSLYLGNAFDIVAERVQTRFRQLGERSVEETLEITLRNHKEEDVVVRVIEHLFRAKDAEIIESSMGHKMLDASTARFDVPVEADGETKVTYTVVYRW
jgi:hypothetical protein